MCSSDVDTIVNITYYILVAFALYQVTSTPVAADSASHSKFKLLLQAQLKDNTKTKAQAQGIQHLSGQDHQQSILQCQEFRRFRQCSQAGHHLFVDEVKLIWITIDLRLLYHLASIRMYCIYSQCDSASLRCESESNRCSDDPWNVLPLNRTKCSGGRGKQVMGWQLHWRVGGRSAPLGHLWCNSIHSVSLHSCIAFIAIFFSSSHAQNLISSAETNSWNFCQL